MDRQQRVALVGSILKGEISVAEAVGKHGLKVAEVEDWGEVSDRGRERTVEAPVSSGSARSGLWGAGLTQR